MHKITLCFILILSAFGLYSQKTVSLESVASHVGETVKICDRVSDTFAPKGEGKPFFLNFGGKYPHNIFSVVIYAKDIPNFPADLEEHFRDQSVCVTGKVTAYKGKPEMVISGNDQITIQAQ